MNIRTNRPFLFTALVASATLALPAALYAQGLLVASNDSAPSNNATTHPSTQQTWHDTVPEKLFSASVRDGVLTVDGMVAKVNLNYDVNNVGYLYFFIPGSGTVIVSRSQMPESVEEKKSIAGKKMTISAGGHTIELTNANSLEGEKENKEAKPSKGTKTAKSEKDSDAVWVALDTKYAVAASFPMMGFGTTTRAPYQWPGSKAPSAKPGNGVVASSVAPPPPLPKELLPKMEVNSSYTVKVGPTVDANGNPIAPAANAQTSPSSASPQN